MIEAQLPQTYFWLAGCDEVGRGPLAGPVVCASVCVLSTETICAPSVESFLSQFQVTDSKKLNSKMRQKILSELGLDWRKTAQKMTYAELKNCQFIFQVEEIPPLRIDELNILHASLTGMKEAFEKIESQYPAIKTLPGKVFVDGPYLPKQWRDQSDKEALVKGDSRSCLIALASILAKEFRDLLMQDLDKRYPGYGLSSHAGYPTAQHKKAIEQLGVTAIHRKSFKGVKEHL